jgi:hypothetical protein
MPFTLSHPAAIGPLWPITRRLRLPLAALAIGAMAPDFEFFLHLRPEARFSHSFEGLFSFSLPVGLAVYLVWEAYVRMPVRALLALPAAPTERMAGWRAPTWWARVVVALLIGAATHVAWDGFTHGGYWGASRWPWLLTPALTLRGDAIPWFNLFQHVSTVVGAIVVLAWLGATLRRAGAFARLRRSRWRQWTLLGLALTAVAAGAWNGRHWGRPADVWMLEVAVGRVAVGALVGLGLATLVFSIVFRHRRGSLVPPAT